MYQGINVPVRMFGLISSLFESWEYKCVRPNQEICLIECKEIFAVKRLKTV